MDFTAPRRAVIVGMNHERRQSDDCAAAVPHSYSEWPPDQNVSPKGISGHLVDICKPSDDASTECWTPDKAAVPVAPDVAQLYTFTAISSPTFTIMSQTADCSWQGFQYDPKTKTCSMRITFDVSFQVVCTPLVLNEQDKPEMTCSFKVIDKGR